MSLLSRVPVQSSLLAAVGYDPDTRVLEVEFHKNKNGIAKVYRANGITPKMFDALVNPGEGESTGRNFQPIKRAYFFDHVALVHPDGREEELQEVSFATTDEF